MGFHTQMASIMEVLANAAVAEICKLVDDDYAVFRLEISQGQNENRALRRKLQLLELKVARERAERTIRERVIASRPSSDKILDRYRGMARGEGHLTGGHKSFVKPAGHNIWSDDQPITVEEGSGTSTQKVIVIEDADAEATCPGGLSLVKQERTEAENPQHSRDIQTGAKSGVAPTAATEDLSTAPQPRTRRSITEVSGMPNAILKSETLTVTQRLLHTVPDHRSDPERLRLGRLGCPPALGSEYLLYGNPSPTTVHSHQDSGDTLDSSSGYSEGCLDKKEEGLVVDEVTVKVEGDVSPTWNADNHLGDGHSQGRDFLDYNESLEANPNVATHSPLHMCRDRDPVCTLMGHSDSHGCVLFNQVLNSNSSAGAQAQGGGATSGISKEKRFLCMFCNKGFSCPQKVEIHQRVHTGEKPFSCNQCHMCFAQASDLKRHQKVHTGEKPFGCHLCQASFSHSFNLKRHQRVHTGENPTAAPSVRRGSPTSTN